MLVGIAIAAVAVWFLLRREDAKKTTTADPLGAASPAGSAGSTSTSATPAPVDKVSRVSPAERKRLAEQIAQAKAKRATPLDGAATGSTGSTPAPELAEAEDAKIVRTTMKDAMREVIPYLAECFDKAGDKVPEEIEVIAEMTLTGDPDIGTIIDTNGLADKTGAPLDPSFDLCLQDAFVSLQMPPLSEGGEVKVTYPFVFARNGPDEGAGSGNLAP